MGKLWMGVRLNYVLWFRLRRQEYSNNQPVRVLSYQLINHNLTLDYFFTIIPSLRTLEVLKLDMDGTGAEVDNVTEKAITYVNEA